MPKETALAELIIPVFGIRPQASPTPRFKSPHHIPIAHSACTLGR